MSLMKEQLSNMEEYSSIIKSCLLKEKIISKCPYGHEYYWNNYKVDDKTIYAICTNAFKEYYETDKVPNLFRDQVKSFLQELDTENNCPACDKIFNKD